MPLCANPECENTVRRRGELCQSCGRALMEKREGVAGKKVAKKGKKTKSDNSAFFALLRDAGLPIPRAEWEFHPERKWQMDYAWPDAEHMLFLEVEGGVWTGGRHTRGEGYLGDVEKYNAAACEGYRLIRCVPSELCTEATVELIREALLGG